jgi:hypothetical protein
MAAQRRQLIPRTASRLAPSGRVTMAVIGCFYALTEQVSVLVSGAFRCISEPALV